MTSLGYILIQYDWCPCKKRKLDAARNTPTEDHGKTQGEDGHLQNQGEASAEPTLPTSSSWTSSPQNCKKIRSCCLSHPVCSTLLWQPEQTAREALIPDVPPLLPSHQSGLSTGAPPPRSLPQPDTLSKHSIPSPAPLPHCLALSSSPTHHHT